MARTEEVIVNDRWYLSTERQRIIAQKNGEIYCYNSNQVDVITGYLTRKEISYYVRFEDFYWVVKFDRECEEE